MRLWPKQRILVVNQTPLTEEELAGAFAITETDVRIRALLQIIDELERDATDAAQKSVANHGICASSNGGAEHLGMLRDRILELQQKGFGKLDSERKTGP